MNKIMSEKPPKIGVEIEANWPPYYSLCGELRAAFEDSIAERSGDYAYARFQEVHGPAGDLASRTEAVSAFYKKADPKYHFPAGWDKWSDSGVEMRFDGPASSLEQAKNLLKVGTDWLFNFGHHRFSGAGTHVHLGHLAWLDERFGKTGAIRSRAEALFWGYFASREKAIFDIAPAQRLSNSYCTPFFTGRNFVHSESRHERKFTGFVLDPQTPSWAIHNHLLINFSPYESQPFSHGGFPGGSICNRRKQLPTIEFRNFEGTRNFTAVYGYVKFLYAMFMNAAQVLTEENCVAKKEDSLSAPVLVNPLKYSVHDFKKEIDDPWLLKWIDATLANGGNPISKEIEIINEPQYATV